MSRVLVIGDTHMPGMHKKYPSFLAKVAKRHNCNRFVHIGDLVDNHQISFHSSEVDAPNAYEESEKARSQIGRFVNRFPKVDMLMGNHDSLHVRRVVEAGLPKNTIKDFGEYWGLPSSWNVIDRFSAIEIDGVSYSHGETGSAGKYAAINQANQSFQSSVCGHFHACFGVWYNANNHHCIFGAATGCGIDREYLGMRYGRKFPRKPILGCLVVIDGETVVPEPMRM